MGTNYNALFRQIEILRAIPDTPEHAISTATIQTVLDTRLIEELKKELGKMRSSRTERLNILKSPIAVSNMAGLSLSHH